MNEMTKLPENLSKGRLFFGVAVVVIGQLTTLLIPLVTASNLSGAWKTTLSSIFFFVTPQLGIFLAVAILGKAGWNYIVKIFFGWFKKCAAPETVGPLRYYTGLTMFMLPVLFAWLEPYCGHMIPGFPEKQTIFYISGDIMFLCSFFVLGGEFWDKIRSLFIHRSKPLT